MEIMLQKEKRRKKYAGPKRSFHRAATAAISERKARMNGDVRCLAFLDCLGAADGDDKTDCEPEAAVTALSSIAGESNKAGSEEDDGTESLRCLLELLATG